jgi:dCMP deaminase
MRISRDEMLMKMAQVASMRSTCSRASVGVVIARDGRVLSTGYNGAPAGMPHCNHTMDLASGCQDAVHAEANAIAYAARYGMKIDGAELFTTFSPCLPCAQLIVNTGIWRVNYAVQYRLTQGLDLLERAGVLLHHMPDDMMDA